MNCLVQTIRGPNQSGKTTIALGALERLHRKGIPVLYVLPTPQWAHDARSRTDVPSFGGKLTRVNVPRHVRAIAIDDVERADYTDEELDDVRRVLELHLGPTLLMIVEVSE
jgi:molybdopterin-guanine dinucleotide biosynthesis protein